MPRGARDVGAGIRQGQGPREMTDAENLALHCLGMCADWEGHPAYQGADDAGLRRFLLECADGLRWQRDEIGRLRVALRVNARRAGATDALAALDRHFGITDSLHGNGCEHGFKPASSCPNADCEARRAHEAWEALNV